MKIDTKVQKAITHYETARKELKAVQKSLMKAIKENGLKKNFIINQLNMNSNTFYSKQRNCTFSIEEMKKIIEIIS